MATHLQYRIGEEQPVRLRNDPDKTWGLVLVVSSKTCNHRETICCQCVESWSWDWVLKNKSASSPLRQA